MKIRIVNLPRFILSTLMVLGIIFVLSLIITGNSLSYKELEYRIIYISNGDTLWSIAKDEKNSNKYYDKKDVRYILEDIKQLNNLENSNLKIGQELKIPVIWH